MKKEYFDEIRLKKGITIERLSEATGIPVGTLSKISSGLTKPSYHNMCLIAKALGCSLDDFTDMIESSLTEDEEMILEGYRSLSNHGKKILSVFLDLEVEFSKSISEELHTMECLVPTGIGGDGDFYESCTVNIIQIDNEEVYENTDFCIQMVTDQLQPTYFRNDILALRYRFPRNGETAVFIHKNRQYIRKYYRTEQGIKLVAINMFGKNIEVDDLRDYICVGTIVTVVRGGVKVRDINKYRKSINDMVYI